MMTTMTRRDGLVDVDADLQHEIELISRRFPTVDSAEIDRDVRDLYLTLATTATVKRHLVTVAGAAIAHRLLARGVRPTGPLT
jgi:hypothetical protein